MPTSSDDSDSPEVDRDALFEHGFDELVTMSCFEYEELDDLMFPEVHTFRETETISGTIYVLDKRPENGDKVVCGVSGVSHSEADIGTSATFDTFEEAESWWTDAMKEVFRLQEERTDIDDQLNSAVTLNTETDSCQ